MKTIRRSLKNLLQGLLFSIAFLPAVWSGAAAAANLSGRTMEEFASAPILTVQSVPPLVMLVMSMDHQYWQKAYNDYTDLNRDGVAERSYLDTFQYYGYFHAQRCYVYSDTDKRFNAVGVATGTNKHYCTGGLDNAWSGNFLNWATMTRMDVVRKMLYGGQRSTDSATQTVLERTLIPGDAHSFAKYYNGSDIASLTPYNSLKSDTTNGGNNNGIDEGDEGISLCNTTYATTGSSQATTAAPLLRAAKGNFSLWNANERRQCTWQDEFGNNSSSNVSSESGIFASAGDPPTTAQLTTPGAVRDQQVRVEVCNQTYFDSTNNLENCTVYGTNLKPEGLLQRYALNGQMKFGLLTGSYQKNISGGVLRKRISPLTDEVNVSNGTFITLGSGVPGIIKTLNAVRIFGYGYAQGTYRNEGADTGGDDCTFQLTNITEGKCASWGNPMSEIYLEAVRYFASTTRAPTAAFDATDTSYITNLEKDTNWASPLTNDNSCASLNAIVFNASVSSYDENATDPTGLTASTAAQLTKTVGDGESITGQNFFIGRNGTLTDEFCTAKAISGANGLGDALGLCPEAPTVRGSYHMAGLAHWAHTNDMSTTLAGAQKLRTFAVSLQTSVPVIKIPVPGNKTVTLLPAYRLRAGGNNTLESSNNPANDGGGTLVDFKIVRPHTEVTSAVNMTPSTGTGFFNGKFYVNWEDSEQGGDYDQDMWGTIEYVLNQNVSPATITVTTQSVAQSTVTGQLFGFVSSGTTRDGFHAYSGIQGANFYASTGLDPSGVKGCMDCRALSETANQGQLVTVTLPGAGSGSGFASNQAVTLLGLSSGAVNASGKTTVSGDKVTGITSLVPGTGYTNGESVRIFPTGSPGYATPATAVVTANPNTAQRGKQSFTFTVGANADGKVLESPLYYAAKWGGFQDKDSNKLPSIAAAPSDNSEWDSNGDGIPDGFFFVTDPGNLEGALRTVFNTILEQIASGTAAAVVANEQKGNGALFQALYDPTKKDRDGNAVSWVGTLHALFVDSFGLIREDGNSNGKIDGFGIDKVVKLQFDDANEVPVEERRTKVIRFEPVAPDPNNPDPADPAQFTKQTPADLNTLKTVWNARERLSDLSNGTIATQRSYSANASTGRHILTWLDGNDGNPPNGIVGTGEVVDFTSSSITNSNYYWLDYFNPVDADKTAGARRLVDWVRGKDTNGSTEFRPRSVDYDGPTGPRSLEVMRLGDIIDSTPVSVGAPLAGFDQSALDPSYATFHEQYANRRQMVYVGANDGMIHAFNAGFFNADLKQFELKPAGTSLTEHLLGSEIWAYVPRNLLPQLQWAARQDYTHVYYNDLPVRVFDVKIFPNDAVHPGGWGTILVAGMRFGGGSDSSGISVDVGADAVTTNNVKTKSAYVVMDITDPERAPTVLAELSPPNLQYTTSTPQVVGFGDKSGNTAGKWYLVFGSGPTDLALGKYSSAATGTRASVYAYDLANMRTATLPADNLGLARSFTLGDSDVFVGDPVATDIDLDMKDEVVYFGTVGGPVAPGANAATAVQGSLYRLLLGATAVGEDSNASNWTAPVKVLSDLNRPFITQPAVTIDNKFRRFLMAASGRLFVTPDKETQNQQTLYGIVDRVFSGAAVPTVTTDLVDVSSAQVFANDRVTGVTLAAGSDANSDGTISVKELKNAVVAAGGWRKNMTVTANQPAERSASRLTLFGGVLFGSLYTPSTNLCGSDGGSRLLGVDFSTGAASLIGVFPCASCVDPTVPLPDNVSLGGGYSSSASIHFGEQTIEGKVTVITQDSRGELEANTLKTGSGDPASEISWREYRGE